DPSGHRGRSWAGRPAANREALRSDGLAGRLSLRLCEEVRREASAGDCGEGSQRTRRHDSGVSLPDVSQPLHTGDGTVSGAPRDRGESVLRSGEEGAVFLQRPENEYGWIVVRRHAAVVAGGEAGHAERVLLLARI